ncbi:MAG: phosphotriesterase [Intestinibacter sp.]
MKNKVMTVLGEIDAADIGKCLMHQHAVFGYPGWQCAGIPFDYNEAMQYVESVVKDAKNRFGLNTFVDATPGDCGRNPNFLKELSERTEVNIIASTGCYYEGEGASAYFKTRLNMGDAPQEIYEMMMNDLTKQIGISGVRAGVIKVATSADEITPYEDLFLQAASKVSSEIGVRIITHTQDGKQGSEQVRRMVEYGVKPEHIMVGHLDGCTDIDELFKIFEYGAYGAFDRLGLQYVAGTLAENRRIALIAGLAMSGFGEKIMLAHDSIAFLMGKAWIKEGLLAEALKNWNWVHVFENIIPGLKKMGVSEQIADAMVLDNPRSFFSD